MSGDRIDALGQRLFQAAREERPDALLQERVRELGSPARVSSGVPPASGARAATRRRPRGVTPWLAAAGALSAAAGLWLLVGEGVGERTLGREREVLISAETRLPVGERLPAPSAPAVVPVVPALAPPSAAREPSTARPSTHPSAVPRAPLESPRAVVPRASTPVPRSESPRAETPRAQSAPPAQPSANPRSVPLGEQLELLKQARALLRSGQPTQALSALDRYETELGGTDLRDEAALLRIEALAAQGRAAEAAALARRFVSEHPDSPLAERAQRLGGSH